MIRRIFSSLPHFKPITFAPGLNILLSDKSAGSMDRHTRNCAGKSSLLEVMHFLLGSKCEKDSIFRNAALLHETFGMEMDLAGERVVIQRAGETSGSLTVSGDTLLLPSPLGSKSGVQSISNEKWKSALGKLMFGFERFDHNSAPAFRSLVSYFIRRNLEGGMVQPMMNAHQQRMMDQQVNVSFLVGLGWETAWEWEQVREIEKGLEKLARSMKDSAIGASVGNASQLRSELIVAQAQARRLSDAVSSFRVVEQYHELESQASQLITRLAEIADANVMDMRYLKELESATSEEREPAPSDLEDLYREANVVLPGLVKRRYDEAQVFHESVLRNRQAYLASEISAAQQRIAARDKERRVVDAMRAEVMGVLNTHGELEKHTAATETLRQRYEDAERLEAGHLKLKARRTALLDRLRKEYVEQENIIQDAVLTFGDISAQLYEGDRAGTLTITPTENGPVFDANISGEQSKGVNNMKIFCFDMMLMLLSLRRGISPMFLVHDSHLFEGVDERQVGRSLALGAALAAKHGFQYIVTMNSDVIPRAVPAGFHVEDYTLPVRLTVASEDGGLFGLRFG